MEPANNIQCAWYRASIGRTLFGQSESAATTSVRFLRHRCKGFFHAFQATAFDYEHRGRTRVVLEQLRNLGTYNPALARPVTARVRDQPFVGDCKPRSEKNAPASHTGIMERKWQRPCMYLSLQLRPNVQKRLTLLERYLAHSHQATYCRLLEADCAPKDRV